jgi:hypothetical protein
MNEQGLWAAVILQAISDATWPIIAKGSGGAYITERERSGARSWLLAGGRDFVEACTMAGLEPSCVQQRAQELADEGWPSSRDGVPLAA